MAHKDIGLTQRISDKTGPS